MTTNYVVIAEQGITHDGLPYPMGAQVQLDAQSAAYHLRHATVRALEAAGSRRKATTVKQGEKE